MFVTKWDICKKEIKGEAVMASAAGFWSRYSFCMKCGQPVTDFIKKYQNVISKNKNGKKKQ
ncbi:MAG: hypothetical protein Q8R34_00410 [bacterium]|nr:hypothetical protein [bacterium]